MTEQKSCPCKKKKCERHGDCAACRAHHAESKRQRPVACEKGTDSFLSHRRKSTDTFPYTIRRLTADEIPAALSLAWEVFSEYESPVYAQEGTDEFRRCLHDEAYLAGIAYYGAFDGTTLVGEIGFRPTRNHICFFFVKGSYHRKGIGTKLFRQLLRDTPGRPVTVNSSPYGLPFYQALGFHPTDQEQTVHGIRFTPMAYQADGGLHASEKAKSDRRKSYG